MRHFNILFAFAFVLLTSCFTDEVDYVGYQPSSKGGIHIIGAVEDYDVKSVGTRAEGDDIADSYISEMTMFIFKDKNNNPEDKDNNKFELIQGYSDAGRTQACTSAINIPRGNPTFLIDTEEGILADLSGSTNSSEVFYDNTTNDLGSCHIYIVANAWDQLILKDDKGNRHIDNIKTLADLEAFVYNVDSTLAMPMIDEDSFRGFPMIGKQQGNSFNLHKDGNNDNNSVATIPLKKLYSKVCFTMQINADQVVAGQTPSFKIEKVEVFNVPNKVRMGRKLDANGKPVYGDTNADDYLTEMGVTSTTTPGDHYHFTEKPFTIDKFNKRTISHSTSLTTDDVIEFGFYMPEHKVTPNTITYPDKITPDAKQYYKPAGVGQSRNGDGSMNAAKIATFVRIHGSYTDHNGQILGVKYDIYLGQNNYDDFTVKRNQQLNNKLIITGLTNHKNAYPDAEHEGNISIDHRVEVSDRGFNLSMERTAILDAHFEVRPLDIELQADASMTVTIPEAYRDWVAMEDDAAASSGKNNSLYVNTSTARKGVRKYFTTNLVSELNAAPSSGTTGNGGTLFFENTTKETKTFRVWFYIDENPNVYDKTGATSPNGGAGGYTVSKEQYRVCPVQFAYEYKKKDENGEVVEVITNTETINFQQWNLWRVWSADGKRYYDIEHEEEYLNNYASDLQYGQTQDGMPWGLDGLQLSDEHEAIYLVDTSSDSFIDQVLKWLGWNKQDAIDNSYKMLTPKPMYDFYLPRDVSSDKLFAREFAGYEMNCDIIEKLLTTHVADEKAEINGVILTENSKSAIAYCYNKNKRNSDGSVCTIQGDTLNTSNLKWYLPSIDEVEDIAKGAYDEFDRVFQGNLYWSCQPAFYYNKMILDLYRYEWTIWSGGVWYDSESDFVLPYYEDNTGRARATRAVVENNQFAGNLPSGSMLYKEQYGIVYAAATAKKDAHLTTNKIINENSHNENPGNLPRTESCRIRAVYRSGTKEN